MYLCEEKHHNLYCNVIVMKKKIAMHFSKKKNASSQFCKINYQCTQENSISYLNIPKYVDMPLNKQNSQ